MGLLLWEGPSADWAVDIDGGDTMRIYNSNTKNTKLQLTSNNPVSYRCDFEMLNGYGFGDFTSFSSRELKDKIRPMEAVLGNLMKLTADRFQWNDTAPYGKRGRADIGCIAEEVEEFFPELVVRTNEGLAALNYPKMTVLLLKGVQELQGELQRTQGEVQQLKRRLPGA
ncbi:MAG TPA: tail fiber domain-containing protein [Dehalococcoidia bacterium]